MLTRVSAKPIPLERVRFNPGPRTLYFLLSPIVQNHPYSENLADLGKYFNLYLDLMAYWRDTLPGFIYALYYESLVADQEDQIRKLFNYCNLPWNDACLDFYNSNRIVKTISSNQVRRPIYDDSVELWKKYKSQLKPLTRILNQSAQG